MSWLAVSLELDAAQAEQLSDALLEAGALSVEISDAQAGSALESPIFGEPGGDPDASWRINRVTALFDAESNAEAATRAALTSIGETSARALRISPVAEQDWVRASQQQFGPVQISSRLWIVPSWCSEPDSSAINLRLDPGLAFGTGAHPTTWQCLRWLEAHLPTGAGVLDYGCGSGVLAIAAKRLGAGVVVGVDIDSNAVKATRENAAANAVEIHVTGPDTVPPGPYDVVVANILSNPLKLLAPALAAFSRPGGSVVLAGILDRQAAEVTAHYAQWYDVQVASVKEGWVCLAGARKSMPD
jgi:ribosomal protein L11 methyltransferase